MARQRSKEAHDRVRRAALDLFGERASLAESRDFGRKAAESFWRAYGVGR